MTHGGDKANSGTVNRPDNVGNNWPASGGSAMVASTSAVSEGRPDTGNTIVALANPGLPQTA